MMNSISFVHADVHPGDVDRLFGPFDEGDPIEYGDACTTLAHLMHKAGAFRSIGDARRNGWDRPIEPGFREYAVGRMKRRIYVLHVMQGVNDKASVRPAGCWV